MTLKDLYKSVAQLGFESSLEYKEGFIYAANRALLQVNSIRPAAGSYVIEHNPPENLISDANFTPRYKKSSEAEIVLEAPSGRAFSFEAKGVGSYTVYKGEKVAANDDINSPNEFKRIFGLIKEGSSFVDGAVKITIRGAYSITVLGAAIYDEIVSEEPKYIPAYEPYSKYDISNLTSDFLALASPPITSTTRKPVKYEVENGRVILFAREDKGIYTVEYNRKPKEIVSANPESDSQIIDLDEDLAALMPMLVAAYVWADDEPEKANYYLQLFRERAAEIEKREVSVKPVRFNDAYGGWV